LGIGSPNSRIVRRSSRRQQLEFLEAVRHNGGIGIVAHSIDDVIEVI
jgi:hypothetical protein